MSLDVAMRLRNKKQRYECTFLSLTERKSNLKQRQISRTCHSFFVRIARKKRSPVVRDPPRAHRSNATFESHHERTDRVQLLPANINMRFKVHHDLCVRV